MTNVEIALVVAIISSIVGPLLVAKYKVYLEEQKKKKGDPVVSALKANALVAEELDKIKEEIKADRVWISQFHNGGNFYPTGKSITKFSVTHENNSLNIPNLSDTLTNIPVSLFNNPFMKLYEDNEILITNYENKENYTYGLKLFAEGLGTKSSYLFALNSIEEDFIGTLGVEWVNKPHNLTEEQLNLLRVKAVSLGTIIGTYLYADNKK